MHRNLDRCLCCDGSDLFLFADLGMQPAANDFLESAAEAAAARRFPLAVNVCRDCFHAQLMVSVDRAAIFTTYPYVSGTTKTLDQYFAFFAYVVQDAFEKPGRVLDIGCNDGSQLVHFAALGWETFGVDAALNITTTPGANAKVVRGFWSEETLRALDTRFDAIVAQNVLAHTDDPLTFLQLCRQALAPGGRLFVQTSQADMIETRQFDTIYHEHLSFFSAHSMNTLAARAGFRIAGVMKPPVHGVSYVFELVLPPETFERAIRDTIEDERRRGRYSLETYTSFSKDIAARAEMLRDAVTAYRARGFGIVGYGAAAKANTFLNYSGVELDYIVDDAPMKQGRYAPGNATFVTAPSQLAAETRPLLLVALAWNFYDEIVERVGRVRDTSNDVFLRYFPKFETRPSAGGQPAAASTIVAEEAPVYNIVIPYRDMPDSLRRTLPRVAEAYRALGTVNIIIVEQAAGRRFNLAKVLNVSFQLYRQGRVGAYPEFRERDIFFFQPADAVPIDYDYCRHHPDCDFMGYTFEESRFYKACSFTNRGFLDVNGFSNGHYGWGADDHDLFIRLDVAGVRQRFIPVPFEVFSRTSPDFLLGDAYGTDPVAQLAATRDIHADGLNTLRFEIVETRKTEGVDHYIVEL